MMSWDANFGVEWIDAATGLTHKLTFPRDVLVSLAGALTANAPDVLLGPQVVVPTTVGGHARMPDGTLLTMGAGGEVYRDGLPMVGIAARQIVVFGNSVYAQGKTNPSWWRWTGVTWVGVPAFDPRVLAELPTTP